MLTLVILSFAVATMARSLGEPGAGEAGSGGVAESCAGTYGQTAKSVCDQQADVWREKGWLKDTEEPRFYEQSKTASGEACGYCKPTCEGYAAPSDGKAQQFGTCPDGTGEPNTNPCAGKAEGTKCGQAEAGIKYCLPAHKRGVTNLVCRVKSDSDVEPQDPVCGGAVYGKCDHPDAKCVAKEARRRGVGDGEPGSTGEAGGKTYYCKIVSSEPSVCGGTTYGKCADGEECVAHESRRRGVGEGEGKTYQCQAAEQVACSEAYGQTSKEACAKQGQVWEEKGWGVNFWGDNSGKACDYCKPKCPEGTYYAQPEEGQVYGTCATKGDKPAEQCVVGEACGTESTVCVEYGAAKKRAVREDGEAGSSGDDAATVRNICVSTVCSSKGAKCGNDGKLGYCQAKTVEEESGEAGEGKGEVQPEAGTRKRGEGEAGKAAPPADNLECVTKDGEDAPIENDDDKPKEEDKPVTGRARFTGTVTAKDGASVGSVTTAIEEALKAKGLEGVTVKSVSRKGDGDLYEFELESTSDVEKDAVTSSLDSSDSLQNAQVERTVLSDIADIGDSSAATACASTLVVVAATLASF